MNRTSHRVRVPPAAWYVLVASLLVVGLILTEQYAGFLLFHSLLEIFSIVVAFGIFTVYWNSRRFLDNGSFLFLGIAYLFVGGIDLLHTLAYEDMRVFREGGSNLATQLWIAGRFVESLSILAAPLFLRRRFDPNAVLAGYAVVVSLLLGAIFYWKIFPACFLEGLTPFKIVSEYVICVILIASLALFYRRRAELDARVYRLLSLSILLTIAAEAAFTGYTTVTDRVNMAGHFLKLASFYVIYVAFVEVALKNPYAVLFRNLKESEQSLLRSEEKLKAINETLEERVAERASLAERRAAQLRVLASELTLAEQRERRRLAQSLHDHLQQFLVTAKLRVGILRRRIAEEDQRQPLEEVESLLDQAIGASRSLTVELSPPVLYEAGLAAGLEWLARHTQQKHGLAVELQTDPEAEPEADNQRVLIFQAVSELLFNVAKHARVKSARVSVSRTDDHQVRVVVSDAGIGFDPAALETGVDSQGGFGLFSIRERLELLGGRLEVDAAPGSGTRVAILLPQPDGPGSPAPTAERAVAALRTRDGADRPVADAIVGAPRPIRVLLADDHQLLREGLVSLLDDQPGIEVVAEAADGETAIELALRARPDVVVMDVTMPRVNGVEATRRIAALLPRVRVIGLSMHEEADMAEAMRRAGAVGYLPKDAPAEQLIAAIRHTPDQAGSRLEESASSPDRGVTTGR